MHEKSFITSGPGILEVSIGHLRGSDLVYFFIIFIFFEREETFSLLETV